MEVELELDSEPREVELPPELERALAGDAEAKEAFDGLSYTHRREYAEWVAGAREPETRERRLGKAVEMLLAGTKHP